MAYELNQSDKTAKSNECFSCFLAYAEADQAIYKDLSFAIYYAILGEVEKGIQHLKSFFRSVKLSVLICAISTQESDSS